MGNVEFSVHVDAPVEEVWSRHIDAPRIPEWFPGVRAVEHLSGPLDREGTVYVLRFGPGRKATETVERVEPPRLHRRQWDMGAMGFSGTATLAFSPDGSGTRIDFATDYQPPGGPAGRLVDRLSWPRRLVERMTRAEIDSFRGFVERERRLGG